MSHLHAPIKYASLAGHRYARLWCPKCNDFVDVDVASGLRVGSFSCCLGTFMRHTLPYKFMLKFEKHI